MENASKALLIAGSILIVILLIAIGVRVFNSTSGTTESVETTMNATEIATFNNKFMAYVGSGKTRAQVISLLNTAIANNKTNKKHIVTVNGNYPENLVNGVAEGTYTISIYTYDVDGYIKAIKFE